MTDSSFLRLSVQDFEFFAEEQRLTIVPSFTSKAFDLMNCRVGPFKAQKPIEVPLWLAAYLKTRKQCKVSIPMIFSDDYIESKIKEEKTDKELLANLPDKFFEMFQILFER